MRGQPSSAESFCSLSPFCGGLFLFIGIQNRLAGRGCQRGRVKRRKGLKGGNYGTSGLSVFWSWVVRTEELCVLDARHELRTHLTIVACVLKVLEEEIDH